MLVPGDVVMVAPLDDDGVVVDRVEKRRSVLNRRSDNRTKTMAANIDLLAIVCALANPPPRTVLLDQLLVFSELNGIAPVLIFTKADLAEAADAREVPELYRRLGYRTLVANPKAGEGVGELKEALFDRHAFLVGVSGVGKSSIFRVLGGESIVGDVSRFGLGKQTTSAARLVRLGTGFLIDSPGVSEFGLDGLSVAELIHGFVEMRAPAAHCRFTDCEHRTEPACGVRAALADRHIARSRYESYCHILTQGPVRDAR
ncbi:MAG: ribosome small subunit-dependent GTPase A [Candidatus Eremiobacteraeota bacterium]|nr:ribosome small subunit-dependent GTPase A [Candidatus Eremiobacteraeota bacterium]